MQKYIVGGAVRDKVLGIEPHDFDYVVIGATPEEMIQKGYKRVGKKFPVFLDESGHEYALARKEIKTGPKHTDFIFDFSPNITLEEDVKRRDFTCNALIYDETNDKILDFVGGLYDIQHKIIRHIHSAHFIEDPLRVLRMCRFAAQLNFNIAPETMLLAKNMVAQNMLLHLSKERIWKEFEKALYTKNFGIFIETMQQCGAMKFLFPDIDEQKLSFASLRAEDLSYKEKFALFLHQLKQDEILYVCKRIRVPQEYFHFASLLVSYQSDLIRYLDLSAKQKVLLLTQICQLKFGDILQDLWHIIFCLYKEKNLTFAQEQCLNDFALLSQIKIKDVPHYNSLMRGPEVAEALFLYRVSLLK